MKTNPLCALAQLGDPCSMRVAALASSARLVRRHECYRGYLKNPGSLQRGCRGCSGYMGICRIQGLALILRILHVPKYLIYLGMMVLQPTKVMQDC